MRMATDIVIALLANHTVEPTELPSLVLGIRAALEGDQLPPDWTAALRLPVTSSTPGSPRVVEPDGVTTAKPELAPAVPIEVSVTPTYIVSLEDGKHYRSLRRHLMAKYGMTPDDYRQKWGLPSDYPMVAPEYAQQRSEVAKRSGLGRHVDAPKSAGRTARSANRGKTRRT